MEDQPIRPKFASKIRADWQANRGNLKGQLVCVAFRIAHWLRCTNKLTFVIGLPYIIAYRLLVEWVLGIEIPPLTRIGPGLILNHGQGLVINNRVVIGAGCRLRHGVTIGNKAKSPECPVLGDGVEVGANAIIIGDIKIGAFAVVGAASVVTRDVAAGEIVVGNPARPIKTTASSENR